MRAGTVPEKIHDAMMMPMKMKMIMADMDWPSGFFMHSTRSSNV